MYQQEWECPPSKEQECPSARASPVGISTRMTCSRDSREHYAGCENSRYPRYPHTRKGSRGPFPVHILSSIQCARIFEWNSAMVFHIRMKTNCLLDCWVPKYAKWDELPSFIDAIKPKRNKIRIGSNKKLPKVVSSSNQGTRTARGADTIAKRQPSKPREGIGNQP